jgi:hypothetical protein
MRHSLPSAGARFHLRDGRKLVFYTVRQSGFRRRTGELLAVAFVLTAAALAATLLAASHAPRHPVRVVPSVAVR